MNTKMEMFEKDAVINLTHKINNMFEKPLKQQRPILLTSEENNIIKYISINYPSKLNGDSNICGYEISGKGIFYFPYKKSIKALKIILKNHVSSTKNKLLTKHEKQRLLNYENTGFNKFSLNDPCPTIRMEAYRNLGFTAEAQADKDENIRLEAYRTLGFTLDALNDESSLIVSDADDEIIKIYHKFVSSCHNDNYYYFSKYIKSPLINNFALNEGAIYACENGNLRMLNKILEFKGKIKLNLNALDSLAFRLACRNNHILIIDKLLSLKGQYKINVHALNDDALIKVCINQNLELLTKLLELKGEDKIDFNNLDNSIKDNAFSIACHLARRKTKDLKFIKVLIEQSPKYLKFMSLAKKHLSKKLFSKLLSELCKEGYIDFIKRGQLTTFKNDMIASNNPGRLLGALNNKNEIEKILNQTKSKIKTPSTSFYEDAFAI